MGEYLGSCPQRSFLHPAPIEPIFLDKGLHASDALLSPQKFHLSNVVQADPRQQASLGIEVPPASQMYEPTDGLMPPSQRRMQMAVATQQVLANQARKKILTDAIRMHELMLRRHPHGCVGMDSPAFPESPVYGDLAVKHIAHSERKTSHAEQRKQMLLEKSSGAAMRGYNPLVPNMDATAFVPSAAGVVNPRPDALSSGVKVNEGRKWGDCTESQGCGVCAHSVTKQPCSHGAVLAAIR